MSELGLGRVKTLCGKRSELGGVASVFAAVAIGSRACPPLLLFFKLTIPRRNFYRKIRFRSFYTAWVISRLGRRLLARRLYPQHRSRWQSVGPLEIAAFHASRKI